MTKAPTPSPASKSSWLLEELQELLLDEDSLAIKDFGEVSDSFVEGYSRFIQRGIPGKTIGLVMIGATINVYSMFGMSEELPDTLRMIADKLEDKGQHH